jgi:hypothetical protein
MTCCKYGLTSTIHQIVMLVNVVQQSTPYCTVAATLLGSSTTLQQRGVRLSGKKTSKYSKKIQTGHGLIIVNTLH